MRGLLLETLLAHIVAKTTPFALSDAKLLVELIDETARALSTKGVVCRFGTDGTSRSRTVCIPGRWKDRDLAAHDRTCAHCAVYRRALGDRRQ